MTDGQTQVDQQVKKSERRVLPRQDSQNSVVQQARGKEGLTQRSGSTNAAAATARAPTLPRRRLGRRPRGWLATCVRRNRALLGAGLLGRCGPQAGPRERARGAERERQREREEGVHGEAYTERRQLGRRPRGGLATRACASETAPFWEPASLGRCGPQAGRRERGA